MRLSLRILACLLISASTLIARADTLDTLTLTGGGNTISYTLPATSSYPDFSLFNFFQESGPATVNGAPGYTAVGQYYIPGLTPVSLVLSVPGSGVPVLDLDGPPFINFAYVPAGNPFPYLPFDVVPTFIPGDYAMDTLSGAPYTLTITPNAATPEPATLALLSTGLTASIALLCRRRASNAELFRPLSSRTPPPPVA
jgi:PEP-CTERM motif